MRLALFADPPGPGDVFRQSKFCEREAASLGQARGTHIGGATEAEAECGPIEPRGAVGMSQMPGQGFGDHRQVPTCSSIIVTLGGDRQCHVGQRL